MTAEDLLPRLATGARLWTANRRLALHWRQTYDRWQESEGRRAWAAPAIAALRDWAGQELAAAWSSQLLLSPIAEARVIEGLLPRTGSGAEQLGAAAETLGLVDRTAVAKAMQRTWRTVEEWEVPLEDPRFQELAETRLFVRTARAMQQELRAKGFVTAAQVLPLVSPGQTEVILTGFDELTPQLRRWLAPLSDRGNYSEFVPAVPQRSVWQHRAANPVGEARAAAAWAARKVQQRRADGAPRGSGQLAIVVTDLAGQKAFLAELLQEELGEGLFSFSLGDPLAQVPLVHAALLLLRACLGPMEVAEWSLLLRSPFFSFGEDEGDPGQRARFAWNLPGLAGAQFGLAEVTALARSKEGMPQSAAAEGLAQLHQVVQTLPAKRASLPEWTARWTGLLQKAGWGRGRALTQGEHQARLRWMKLLVECNALHVVEGPVTAGAAWQLLRSMAAETIFQVEEEQPAPVQVMEALQAAGASYDGLWVMGTTNQNWPAPPRPDPFLPWQLQKERKLPQSSAEREMQYARRMMERLMQSAPESVWSWPAQEEDAERKPSVMIDELPQYAQLPSGRENWVALQMAAAKVERLVDETGPPVGEGDHVSGGTQLLKAQSLCPFQAFAKFRLRCGEPARTEFGIDALERGNILHRALEIFWKKVASKAELVALASSDAELQQVLEEVVGVAVQEKLATQAGRQALVRLEGLRAQKVLRQWLGVELERADFTVEQLEQKRQVQAGPFQLNIIADRIDRQAEGLVVLDYKSGQIHPSSWKGERPKEPQLPFYATRMETPPALIAFAQIKAGQVQLLPWREDELAWPEQLEAWRKAIDGLIDEAARGHAAATPQKGACERCHLPTLCRIAEGPGGASTGEAGGWGDLLTEAE